MKLKTLLFSAFMLTTFFMMAQDWSTDVYRYGEFYPGYVIDADGKKTEGFIQYANRNAMQTDFTFRTDKDDRKSKVNFDVKDLKEYKIADKLYHVINYGELITRLQGILVVKEGCITQYTYYGENSDVLTKLPGESDEAYLERKYPSKTLFLKDGDDKVMTVATLGLGYAKKMSEYISDNADLSQKVADKEDGYKVVNMFDVIDMYNAACEKK